MARPRAGSLRFGRRIVGGAWLAVALAVVFLATPAFAQDAGVSGIPPGPANINGLNNTGRDPSGIGNAARIAPLPPPNLAPVPVPGAVPLTSTGPALVRPPRVYVEAPRRSHLSPRERRISERARIRENNRLPRHGVPSICRGC
jgi:hypothetical protein